jgi:hypothetical protein
MNSQPEIKITPGAMNWIGCVPAFLLSGIIGAILPMLAVDYFYLHSATGHAPKIVIVIPLGFGAFVGTWFVWRLFDRLYWRLTETELIGGIRGKTKLSLSDLQKIVIGLPNKFPIPGMEKFAPPQIRANSMLLCFSDNSLLPIHFHGMPNGTRLMNELISRYKERVDTNYSYSADEIKILRKADINVLIKRNSIS